MEKEERERKREDKRERKREKKAGTRMGNGNPICRFLRQNVKDLTCPIRHTFCCSGSFSLFQNTSLKAACPWPCPSGALLSAGELWVEVAFPGGRQDTWFLLNATPVCAVQAPRSYWLFHLTCNWGLSSWGHPCGTLWSLELWPLVFKACLDHLSSAVNQPGRRTGGGWDESLWCCYLGSG